MSAPSAIRQNTRYSGCPSTGIEINRPEAKARGPSSMVLIAKSSSPSFPQPGNRSNDSRYDDEHSIRDEYSDDLRDNHDDYSTIADYSTVAADYSTVAEEEQADDFGFSAKFFCCDSTMSWGFRLCKEDEDTEVLGESERNVKRGIIPHLPQRGRSLAWTDSFPRGRGRSLSRTDERRGRSHSKSRSFSGAMNTSTAKKFKGLFSKVSRKKPSTSNKETAPTSIPPTYICDGSDSNSLTKAKVERLKSQLEDLKKAEEERRRQAELLEAATNATNEEEKRAFAEAAALAAEAATKALDDEEAKREGDALLVHQMDAIDKIISSDTPIDQKPDVDTTDDIAQDAITKRVLSNEPIDLLDGPPSELNRERSDVTTTSDTSASIRIHSDCHATELQLVSVEEDDNSILEEVVAAAVVEEAVDVGTGIDERDVAAGGSIDRGGRDFAMQEEGGRQQTVNRQRSDASTADTSASTDSENSFIFVDGSHTDVNYDVLPDDLSLNTEDIHDDHPLVTHMDKAGGVKLACDPFPFIDRVDDAAFYSAVCSPCRGCFDEQSQSDEQWQSPVSEGSAFGEGGRRLRSTSPNAAGDSAQPALLAAEAATKALDDEETKRAVGALLAHQMEEDRKAGLDQNKQEDEKEEEETSPDTTISKDSSKVEANVDKEIAENSTSKVSTENGSEGTSTDSERNEDEEKKMEKPEDKKRKEEAARAKKASKLKEKERKEEAAREKKASELKEKKRKEEAAHEKKASELKEKKAAQKVRREYPHLFLVSAFVGIEPLL